MIARPGQRDPRRATPWGAAAPPARAARAGRRRPPACGGGVPDCGIGLREPPRGLVEAHDGGVDRPRPRWPAAPARRRVPGRTHRSGGRRRALRARPSAPAPARTARPCAGRAPRAVAPSSPSTARGGMATSCVGWLNATTAPQPAWPSSSTRIRCSPLTRSRNTTPPATGIGAPPSSATCASADPRHRQRSARPLRGSPPTARAKVGHAPGAAISRVFSVRAGVDRRRPQVVRVGARARLGGRRVRGRVPVGARGRDRAIEVEVGELVGRQPGAARRRHLGGRRVEIVQRLAERDLLRVEDAGPAAVGRARRGRAPGRRPPRRGAACSGRPPR